ncbi:unnamed protein product [Parnassius mnemosyne]|uniref:Chitin-binding type-2 domain-containing protein n=1 Tax=Parnassius mnemosyne TaxID=213953 RepID=A0AAV1K877_9NEOP
MTRKWLFIITCLLSQGVSKAGQCTSQGRFPNQYDECRGFTMCISGAAGYMEYNLTCPETFIFSHIENLCTNVTSYKCFPDYNCTAVGNFEADSTENCRAFISCVEGISGLVAPRLIECPQGTVFNLTENSCVNETLHKCNKSPKVLTVLINHVPKFSEIKWILADHDVLRLTM